MDSTAPPNPFVSIPSLLHRHLSRFASDVSARIDHSRRLLFPPASPSPKPRSSPPPFASSSAGFPRHAFDVALSTDYVARTLSGTSVYTVSNSNNEFVLISDPDGIKSLGLLCFRQEDAEALLAQVLLLLSFVSSFPISILSYLGGSLAQVQLRQPILGKGARVVPITLDQVYMLKVEGIAFRFLPDPTQIRNALELKSVDQTRGFDGVPVFQSDLLVVKKKNKRYCPIYFQKEDIEQELRASKASKSGLSQHIMVGSLEDVLKKMEINSKNSGWEDLIFIPPGKSYSQHLKEIPA
ncbi:hypothetical protein QJS04_geneDACA021746 [Acorus gramineus]|uniref:Protein TIC 22, chloroplastic n=1 Tax=Acorus gramineus TaxID=55184 RepID=A0AAV9AFQ5_ACOGR|nr:hypothetical protein QJS04_geneDACA021746 [Acorus gramineus]